MLKAIKSVINLFQLSGNGSGNAQESELPFAVAILLVEAMHADHEVSDEEKDMVTALLKQQFDLSLEDSKSLVDKASGKMNDAVSLHEYTSIINQNFSYQDKKQLILNIWKVIFSDGRVDKYEDHLVRRISNLIYLSHTDFIKTKHQAGGES